MNSYYCYISVNVFDYQFWKFFFFEVQQGLVAGQSQVVSFQSFYVL